MERGLDALQKVVRRFPVRDLHIDVHRHARTGDYHLKTTLRLPGRTLFTGERDRSMHPAYERCIRKLVGKVVEYRRRMESRR